MKEKFDIDYLFITRGEFGLYNYKAKDFSDLHDVYSNEEIDNFIDETLTYIKLTYETDGDVTNGDTFYNPDLPYF